MWWRCLSSDRIQTVDSLNRQIDHHDPQLLRRRSRCLHQSRTDTCRSPLHKCSEIEHNPEMSKWIRLIIPKIRWNVKIKIQITERQIWKERAILFFSFGVEMWNVLERVREVTVGDNDDDDYDKFLQGKFWREFQD